jgi:DNA polymerase/3'-5' exonuclease PolX
MSTSTSSLSLREARAIASEMVEALRPYCERVEVAGSIRRGKDRVNDIEIVAIPKTAVKQPESDLFGKAFGGPTTVRDPGFLMVVDSLADVIVKGSPQTGRYVQFYTAEAIKVDLFLCRPENWGYIFLIRTGSAEFSKMVALRWSMLGYKGVEGMLTRNGTPQAFREEWELFAALGMNTPPPHERELTANGLKPWVQ